MIEAGGVDVGEQQAGQPGILLQQAGYLGEGELFVADELEDLLYQRHIGLVGPLINQLRTGEKAAGKEVDPRLPQREKSAQVSMFSAIRLCSVGWHIPSSPIQYTSRRLAPSQRGSRLAPCTASLRRLSRHCSSTGNELGWRSLEASTSGIAS